MLQYFWKSYDWIILFLVVFLILRCLSCQRIFLTPKLLLPGIFYLQYVRLGFPVWWFQDLWRRVNRGVGPFDGACMIINWLYRLLNSFRSVYDYVRILPNVAVVIDVFMAQSLQDLWRRVNRGFGPFDGACMIINWRYRLLNSFRSIYDYVRILPNVAEVIDVFMEDQGCIYGANDGSHDPSLVEILLRKNEKYVKYSK